MIARAFTAAVLGLSILGTTAFAGTSGRSLYPRGSFVINNPTDQTLHYQIKWGEEDWKNFDVEAGGWVAHYVDLDADQKIPVPLVRFDCVTHDDGVTTMEYELDAYGVFDVEEGKDYLFRYTSDGRFVDLFAE